MTAWLSQTRVRLALAYSGIFSVVALIAAVALTVAVARIEYSAVDDSLAAQARSLQPAVELGNPLPGGSASQGQAGAVASTAGFTVFVFSSGGTLLDSAGGGVPPDLVTPLVPQVLSGGAPTLATVDDAGTPQRLRAAPVQLRNGEVRVLVVAHSRAEADQVVATTATVLLAGMLVLVIAASVLGYGLAGTALRPVREIVSAAREFSERDLHRRIRLDLPSDELGELADTFNAMLARLETAFDSLSRFTADAAHELRAPLALIRTEAEVTLRRGRTAEEYQASLGTVLAEAERLGRMADQLLMLSRAEAGALAVQMADVDVTTLIDDAVHLWQPLAAKRQVRLTVTAAGGSAVLGDADLLRRLLDNLVDNALRYSPPESTIEITSRVVDRTLEIAVADSGPGVPETARASIFERFSRADQSRTRATGGAGLGLALCAAIAHLHGGAITLEQRPGSGARFVTRLPVSH